MNSLTDDPDDMDPAEVEAKSAEINKDMANGNGVKHFEDVFDSLHSNPSQQHDVENAEETSEERDRKERAFQELARAFKARLRMMLNTGDSEGMTVDQVRRNIGGRGFLVYARDRVGREFEFACDFDTLATEMQLDPLRAFIVACDFMAKGLKEARRKYHLRAGLS